MAWNTLKYECGHTTREQLYGPMAQRERTIERALDRLCPDCYAAKLEAERAEESAAAAEAAKDAGLPALTGSEKQIAWAESIRAKQVAELSELDKALATAPAKTPDQLDAVRIGREVVADMIARTSAKDWIEGRDTIVSMQWLSQQIKVRMGK